MARASRPSRVTDDEHARLRAANLDDAPAHVRGDYPEWLDPHLAATFGEDRAEEAVALASRAPLDLRVNTLKGERAEAAEALGEYAPQDTRWSPWGLRIVDPPEARKVPRSTPSPRT